MANEKILIIEDEHDLGWLLTEDIKKAGFQPLLAEDGEKGLEMFQNQHPDLVITDLKLPKMDGLAVLTKLLEIDKNTPVIIMTGYGSMDTANSAIKIGAFSYLEKPFNRQELVFAINKAIESRSMREEMNWLREEAKKQVGYEDFVGHTPRMRELMRLIDKVSDSEAPTVLLEGESGTGKNFVARMIHFKSRRANSPFMEINCASLPETLIESELFGHERGAFTDAKQMKRGLFEVSRGGTVFLDEIAEMTITTQAKLLHVIENRTFRRLGGVENLDTNVRVVTATSIDLRDAVSKKKFREDLFFRLQLIPITIPPLRERIEDLPILIDHFVQKFNKDYHKNIKGITPEAHVFLKTYPWPGNVRELKNLIERIAILENNTMIGISHLPTEIRSGGMPRSTQPNYPIPMEGVNLEDVEKNFITEALRKTAGNQSRAAKLLGITRHTLRYRMEKFGLRTAE